MYERAQQEQQAAAAGGDGAAPNGAGAEEEQALEAEALEQDVEELIAKAAERDEYLALAQRTQADFENYRKRAAKEAAAAGSRAKPRLLRELLPVLDNLERALATAAGG